jgi:hypothetical protein
MKRDMRQVSAEAPMTDPIDRAPFYHDGMRELQDRFDGRRVADALEKHRLHFEFWEQERKLIEETRFFFIATSYRDNVDCSMRSGDPGFVRITGPDTLEYPEYDGNNMYRTLGNIAVRAPRRQDVSHAHPRQGNDPRQRGSARRASRRESRRARQMRDLPKLPALHSRPDGRFRFCTGESVRSSTRVRAAGTRMEKPGLPQRRALQARSASETRGIAGGARVTMTAQAHGSRGRCLKGPMLRLLTRRDLLAASGFVVFS